jgi:type IV fimbrial biogenesis protein FimT
MTSIDWLVVMGVLGIMLAMAVPGILGMLEGQRVNVEASALANDLHFARSEAVKRGQTVSVCVSLDGGRCATNATAWHSGWIVFLDRNADQTVSAGDNVLRIQKAWTSTDTFTNHSTAALTYNKDGFAQNMSTVLMLKLQTASADASSLRCLVANRFGQQRVLTVGKGAYGKTCM